MKITQAYNHQGTWVMLPEGKTWPVMPDENTFKEVGGNNLLYLNALKQYREALTSALEHSIPFEDKRAISLIVRTELFKTGGYWNYDSEGELKFPDGLYTIPESEGEIVDTDKMGLPNTNYKVFRLTPSTEQKPLTLQEAKDKSEQFETLMFSAFITGQANEKSFRQWFDGNGWGDMFQAWLKEYAALWNKSLSEEIERLRKVNDILVKQSNDLAEEMEGLIEIHHEQCNEVEAEISKVRKELTVYMVQDAEYLEALKGVKKLSKYDKIPYNVRDIRKIVSAALYTTDTNKK